MNKIILFIALLAFIFSFISAQTTALRNGVFEGRSCSIYGVEPYVGVTIIKIENGKIIKVTFQIIDTTKNEYFDQNYSTHFPTQPIYQEQCKADWKGVLYYPVQLLKKQDLNNVDALTGATWSHNLFVSSTAIALKKAKAKTENN